MFRRARLSVKPNVRPGVGARGSAAPHPQRGRPPPGPREPAEPVEVPAAEPPPEPAGSSDEKTSGENNVEESSKSPPPVSQRRKRVSSTSRLTKPSVPEQSHPLSPVSQDAPQPSVIPAKEKPPCSDRYRIYKAQKLREMLKEELRKEKKQWKNKYTINESHRPPDRSKMTMRDFIYYLPDSNPMTSSLEQEKKTEKSLTPTQTKDRQENKGTPDAVATEEVDEEEDDGPLLVPRVKVAEDGSIILDEESLTVEVLRTKGPCVVEENDPIFERGSTTTYSSFRKNYYSKPWSNKETDMFFLAISMVGTDFSMIGQLFPHRARIEIKNKFKREEKTNGWRIDKAFQEKRPFDFDFFAHLLQKVLAEEEKRKQKSTKSQNLKEKKSSKSQKNVKAKTVSSGGVSDDLDESVSANLSDPECSPKEIQTIEEEEPLTSSGQGSEQVVLEQAQSHEEANKQDNKNLLENATIQSGSSEADTHQSKCQPEASERECNKEQNIDDIDLDLVSSEKPVMTTEPVPLTCDQQDTQLVATESESSTSDFPVPEAGIAALCEESKVESSCTEESHVDLKSKPVETDQIENVKPTLRGRLLRPKPNLSRAVGKKSACSQGKTDGESKNSCSETPVAKDLMEKEKMNISDSFAMENAEKENPEAETISNVSEKTCQQEDKQPKVCRPARLRTRMQRPRPNLEKAAEKEELLLSQEKDIPQQTENQSCKIFQCEDIIISQTEEKDVSFQNVQPDKPRAVSECVSIQEGNKANQLKPAPVPRTRFQKPKPNIGTGRRGISSKEEATGEIIVSGEMTTALRKMVAIDTSPRENVPSCIPTAAAPTPTPPTTVPTTTTTSTTPTTTSTTPTTAPTTTTSTTPTITTSTTLTTMPITPTTAPTTDPSTATPTISATPPTTPTTPTITAAPFTTPTITIAFPTTPTTTTIPTISATAPTTAPTPTPTITTAPPTTPTTAPIPTPTITAAPPTTHTVTTITTAAAAAEAKELKSDLIETGENDVFPSKMAEITDFTVEMEIGLEETERDISPGKMTPEMIDITLETDTGMQTPGNVSPREKMPEMIEEINTNLEETGKREIFPQEKVFKDVSSISKVETGLQETGKKMSIRERAPDMIDITDEKESDLEEPERQEISVLPRDPEEVKTIEMETELKEIGGETFLREKTPLDISTTGEKEIDLKETGERDISRMEVLSGKMTALEETKQDLKEPGREISISWERSEEICVNEEMGTDLRKTGNIGISPREPEPEERDTSEQTVTNSVMQSRSGGCNTQPTPERKNLSMEASVVPAPVEEEQSADKDTTCPLHHVNAASQHSGLGELDDQGIQPPAVLEQFSDGNLSKSLPQEQKPLEVKPAPFVRSRFKRPKPNLSRAVLKREATEAEKCVPEKKPEASGVETTSIQQDREQTSALPSQNDVTSLMTSKENDKLGDKEAVIRPHIQTEKEPSPSNSYESKEQPLLSENQENDLVVSMGIQKTNTIPEETKQSAVQSALPTRGRLKRPRPNVQRARQRATVEKGETEVVIKGDRTLLWKDEAKEKSLTEGSNPEEVQGHESNSQIETEIEVVSSRVSECRVNENQSNVVPVANVPINKRNVLDEEMRPENKQYVPSPAPLIRRHFQKVKPNLGTAPLRKSQPGVDKGTTDQSEAQKAKYDSIQQADLDNQLPPKEMSGIETSGEISTKDCIDSKESGLATKDAQLEVESPGNHHEETIGNHPMSSVVEEQQHLGTQTSHPQIFKESHYSKLAPHRRTAVSPASECELDPSGRRVPRKIKANVSRGRGAKRMRGKVAKKEPRASKSMLVTLRASHKEDEDDAEDFESDYEDETCHLAPEELSKAPVFVPVGLRSPAPVSAQIEETMEELEITVNVADEGCVTVVEPQLSNTDVTTQDSKQENNLHTLSFEMMEGKQIQQEPGPSDGSTEAAITLLTMGEIVLQSELSTEKCDVGLCVFPDDHSEDQNHIPCSTDNVNHKIAHEYQELSSSAISVSPTSFDENKIGLKEQSTKEETGIMEETKETNTPTRDRASTVITNLEMESGFVKPKSNIEKILGHSGFSAHQEVPNICVAKETEVEIQRETEKNEYIAVEMEDKNLGPIAESKAENQPACVHDIKGTSMSQEADVPGRNEDHDEEKLQEAHILSVIPLASSETRFHTLDSGSGLGESSVEETLDKAPEDDSVLVLHVPPQGLPTNVPEVQQENVINPQDQTVNLFADLHQDGEEEEQAFILTLVEIPTNAAEGFTDAAVHLMPSPLLPAPILVKSGNKGERGDLSGSLPATPLVQDAMHLSSSDSGREDFEKQRVNLDLPSRKRFHSRLDESDRVPPVKKSSLTSRVGCQEFASEVFSKELNVFEETGESHKEQVIFPASGSITPKPQKEKIEPTLQNIGSGSFDEIRDSCTEKNMIQLPQEEMAVSAKEERSSASSSEQMDNRMPSSKPPLSRPGRRPLGFLSLICSKNNLDSDETTQVHSKKRLKPLIPVSRRTLKKSSSHNESQKKIQESCDSLSSTNIATTPQSENVGSSSTQVSSDQPSLNGNHKNGQKRAPQEEPTNISESFFGDIFIQVDENE